MDNPSTASGVYLALATRFTSHTIRILDTDPLTTDPVLASQTLADEKIVTEALIRTFVTFLKHLVPDGTVKFVDKIPFAPDMTFIEARKLLVHALIAGSVTPAPAKKDKGK